MMSKSKRFSIFIMIVTLILSFVFIYDYNPTRDIIGFKAFYDSSSEFIIIGQRKQAHHGDRVVVMQDEQANFGILNITDEKYNELRTEGINITITDGVIYKVALSANRTFMISVSIIFIIAILLLK